MKWRKAILDSEKALVERAKSDKQAFAELYDRYYSPIFGYVLRRTADVEVARDVTSQVFLKALIMALPNRRQRGRQQLPGAQAKADTP
jgi:DNA-directed RNA polymerase specialized sigma24 family protein